MNTRGQPANTAMVCALAFVLALAWLAMYGWVPCWGRVFAYRDAGHYFYPLLQRVRVLRADHFFPLWEPAEDLGRPWAADATAAVFYPPAWLLCVPLPFPRLYSAYIALHAALAMVTMAWTLKLEGHRAAAIGCGALSYGLGGYVVAQHANVPYLAGAAWLPLAMASGRAWLVHGNVSHAGLGAAALGLMVLAGDPQTAYHVMLMVPLYAVPLRTRQAALPSASLTWRRIACRWIVLGAAGIVLAAPQVWLSGIWSRGSTRAWDHAPRSVWERLAWNRRGWQHDDATEPDASTPTARVALTHGSQIYRFSCPAWRGWELIWPNASGYSYPLHGRWTQTAWRERGVWHPSWYAGALPLACAAGVWLGLRRNRALWGSAACVIWSWIAATGEYGPGSALNALAGTNVDGSIGGVYWFMVQWLPAYALFRYPSKWLVFVAWGLALMSARGWDTVFHDTAGDGRRFIWRWCLLLSGLSLPLFGAVLIGRSSILKWCEAAPSHPVWGPLDGRLVFRVACMALLQPVLVAWSVWFALVLTPRYPRCRAVLLVGLVALDLLVANRWQVATLPEDKMAQSSAVRNAIDREESREGDDRHGQSMPRIYRALDARWYPRQWSRQASRQRIAEIAAWEQATLHPKYHLGNGRQVVGLTESSGPAIDAAWASLLRVARQRGPAGRDDGGRLPSPSVLRGVGIDYLIVPPGASTSVDDVQWWRATEQALVGKLAGERSRVYLTRDVRWVTPVEAGPPDWLDRQTRRLWGLRAGNGSPSETILVERVAPPPIPEKARNGEAGAMDPTNVDTCVFQVADAQKVRFKVNLTRPALLVYQSMFDAGWRVQVDSQSVGRWSTPALRAGRVLTGIWLPAGTHEVVLHYRPTGLRAMLVLAALGWGAVILRAVLPFCAETCKRASENGPTKPRRA